MEGEQAAEIFRFDPDLPSFSARLQSGLATLPSRGCPKAAVRLIQDSLNKLCEIKSCSFVFSVARQGWNANICCEGSYTHIRLGCTFHNAGEIPSDPPFGIPSVTGNTLNGHRGPAGALHPSSKDVLIACVAPDLSDGARVQEIR